MKENRARDQQFQERLLEMNAAARESDRQHMEVVMKLQADNQAQMTQLIKEINSRPP